MNLIGKRILITRPRKQAEESAAALLAEGAQPILFPVIQITPPDNYSAFDFALQHLEDFDWLILTSVHGVEAFFQRLATLGIKQIPPGLHVAAVGSKTAQSLAVYGALIDYVPDEYLPDAILPGLGKNLQGKRFLFPQSNLARTVLTDQIRSAGGFVTEVIAYRTIASEPDHSEMDELRAGLDVVTFTSPSAVRNFVDIAQKNGLDPFNLKGNPLFVCIGPVTKEAAEEAGFVNLVAASEYTTAGLIEALTKSVYSQLNK
jgi:uroporphyrinogen-III synthase